MDDDRRDSNKAARRLDDTVLSLIVCLLISFVIFAVLWAAGALHQGTT